MLQTVKKAETMPDMAEEFARHIVAARFDDLPLETIIVTKRSILDTIGVAVGASGIMPEVKALVELVKEGGGKPESTIWGFGGRVPSWMAAYANGAMAHSLDYDDVYDDNGVHPSATCVPAVLAIAERVGGVTGKDLILAVALGNDLISRMSQAVSAKHGWFLTPTFGVFSAAASCAKVLRLTVEQTVDAFGIAFCQSAGTMEIVYGTDSNIRAMYECFVGKTGVLAALMAQRGISGVKSSMEGQKGLFNVYFDGEYDRSKLTSDLGVRFEGNTVSFKAWPFCRRAHPAVTSVISLLKRENIPLSAIMKIVVDTNSGSEPLCVPTESRVRPKTLLDAKFSIPYTVATAVLKQWVGLEDFNNQAIIDKKTTELAGKVQSRLNPSYEGIRGMTPGRVEITTTDGRVFTQVDDYPYGHPGNPISVEDSTRKFRECAARSIVPLDSASIDRLITIFDHLEAATDVNVIPALLGGE